MLTNRVWRDLDGADLQRLRINPDVQLAPLASVLRAMLLALPFALAHHFQNRAVDQQVQPLGGLPIRIPDHERLLASANRAVVRLTPATTSRRA